MALGIGNTFRNKHEYRHIYPGFNLKDKMFSFDVRRIKRGRNENLLVKHLLKRLFHRHFERMADHPRIGVGKVGLHRAGDAVGTVGRGDLVMMCATLLIVALFLLGGVIRFLTEPWKKKGESLLTTLLALLVLAVVAFLVLRRVPLPGM